MKIHWDKWFMTVKINSVKHICHNYNDINTVVLLVLPTHYPCGLYVDTILPNRECLFPILWM